jgi:hypothetical protein
MRDEAVSPHRKHARAFDAGFIHYDEPLPACAGDIGNCGRIGFVPDLDGPLTGMTIVRH